MFFVYLCSLSTWHCCGTKHQYEIVALRSSGTGEKIYLKCLLSCRSALQHCCYSLFFHFTPLLWHQTMSFDYSGSIDNWTLDRPKQTHVGTLYDQWTETNSCFMGKTANQISVLRISLKRHLRCNQGVWDNSELVAVFLDWMHL